MLVFSAAKQMEKRAEGFVHLVILFEAWARSLEQANGTLGKHLWAKKRIAYITKQAIVRDVQNELGQRDNDEQLGRERREGDGYNGGG